MTTIDLSPELIDHFLNDGFWDAHDGSWPEMQTANQDEVDKLNLAELPCYGEELTIELCNHPKVTEVDFHNFPSCAVLTFRADGKHYKFDIWNPGPGTHYNATRWSDDPWTG